MNEPEDPDQIPTLREPRYSQWLERGLAILGCFTPERPVLGIADIADDSGYESFNDPSLCDHAGRARVRAGRVA